MLNYALPEFNTKPRVGCPAGLQVSLAVPRKCNEKLPQNERHIFHELFPKFKLKRKAECCSHQLIEILTDFSAHFQNVLQKDL